jgi:RNA polymerase sigma-70 factor, ECF subfamily
LNPAKAISYLINIDGSEKETECLVLPDEEELIQGCIRGIKSYENILYKTYSSTIYGICLRYADGPEEARDMTHESLIKVFLYLKNFRRESSLKTYISRIAINHAIYHQRKNNPRSVNADVYNMDIIDESEPDYFEESENEIKIKTDELLKFIQKLPFGYRAVLNMYVIDELSHKEIAKILRISESTSKSQLHKARKMMKKLIDNR